MHKKKTCASHRCAFASDDFCANTLGPPRRLISTLIRKALVVGDLPLREQLPLKVSTTHEGGLDALELCALGGAERTEPNGLCGECLGAAPRWQQQQTRLLLIEAHLDGAQLPIGLHGVGALEEAILIDGFD